MNNSLDTSKVDLSTPIESLSFEQAFQELEKIVFILEQDDLSLETSIGLYERGQGLARHCARLLEEAELKILQISSNGTISDYLPES